VVEHVRDAEPLRVVLFSGGRGSGGLAVTLVKTPGVALTVAVNGYDDGASTGEVRRFLGDALGPSDFRKNASRLAAALGTCPTALVELLDRRLPDSADEGTLRGLIEALGGGSDNWGVAGLDPLLRRDLASRLQAFSEKLREGTAFAFADCAVGNLVFAGGFLHAGRRFNAAVDDYCSLVGLPAGLIENVTDGTNAHLVALSLDGEILASEATIVNATRKNRIREIYLLPAALDEARQRALQAGGSDLAASALTRESLRPPLNPRLAHKLAAADLIVYAPGTQHSSLFPSYLTRGLSEAVAANLRAIKLLITNIQTDAEIAGSSAVDIIERALFYLKDKGRVDLPAPALVTHYLVNDPGASTGGESYVPLGRLDTLLDPRLIRVGQYEEGSSGRHDAGKVLGPFVSGLLTRRRQRRRVAVLLYGAGSADKLAQSLLEMSRGGLSELPVDVTAICETKAALPPGFVSLLPVRVLEVGSLDESANDDRVRDILRGEGSEYVVLFESSGMYNGEDIPWLVNHLTGRLDAVWGSRRLSVRDIEESYRLKYHRKALQGAASYVGSHVLSLSYLALYGRYVSDTLSGARAVRAADAWDLPVPLTDRYANQHLLSGLLRRKAEMFEIPVHFYSISPDQVRRTTVSDGLGAIAAIVRRRFQGPRREDVGATVSRSTGAASTPR
jgi:2-phospho-L-lactate transferase/gluconeogenesis factor (CofD/UPF0052 family)